MDDRRAALVEKVEKLLPQSDVSVWDYIDLALEEAARVAQGWNAAGEPIAAAIRALKEKTNG